MLKEHKDEVISKLSEIRDEWRGDEGQDDVPTVDGTTSVDKLVATNETLTFESQIPLELLLKPKPQPNSSPLRQQIVVPKEAEIIDCEAPPPLASNTRRSSPEKQSSRHVSPRKRSSSPRASASPKRRASPSSRPPPALSPGASNADNTSASHARSTTASSFLSAMSTPTNKSSRFKTPGSGRR